jgi:hypothetical protein
MTCRLSAFALVCERVSTEELSTDCADYSDLEETAWPEDAGTVISLGDPYDQFSLELHPN